MSTTYYLYRVSFPDKFFYIGVTSNVERRLKAHSTGSARFRSALGAKIANSDESTWSVEVLGEYPDRVTALAAEHEIVDTSDPFNLNIIEGGGLPPSYGQTSKPLSIGGKEYPSIKVAASALGLSRSQLDHRIKTGRIKPLFLGDVLKIDQKGKVEKVKRRKFVLFDGKEYSSYVEVCETFSITKDEYLKARKEFQRSHVTLAEVESLRIGKKPITINGNQYQSRREALQEEGISNYQLYKTINGESRNPAKVKVKQIDLVTGEVIGVHNSLSLAAQHIGASNASKICMCCRSQRSKAHGYNWEYASDPKVAI